MEELAGLKKKRGIIKGSITKIETFIKDHAQSETDIDEYLVRLEHLENKYDEYCQVQTQIEELDESQTKDRDEIEDKYLSVKAKIKGIIRKYKNDSKTGSSSSQISQVRVNLPNNDPNLPNEDSVNRVNEFLRNLPVTTEFVGAQEQRESTFGPRVEQHLELNQPVGAMPSTPYAGNIGLVKVNPPNFSGKYDEWQGFIDLFQAVIDNNNSLTNVQKFLYLKMSLDKEPLSLIENLPLNNDNYDVALNILKNRYDNKVVIVNSHIRSMLEVNNITKGEAVQYRRFLTQITQHLNALKALNIDIDSWEILLVYLFSEKLDFQTRKAYELERNSTALPVLSDFLGFIEKRCVAMENLPVSEYFRGGRNSGKPEDKSKKFSHHTNENPRYKNEVKQKVKCKFCQLIGHDIQRCFKFKNIGLSERKEFVQKEKLCYNCLGGSHISNRCSLSGCKLCKRRHHLLLHMEEQQHEQQESSNLMESQSGKVNHEEEQIKSTVMVSQRANSEILLGTAIVDLVRNDGRKISARALLDSASQMTFISKKLIGKLGIRCFKENLSIGGVGCSLSKVNEMGFVTIKSRVIPEYEFKVKCAVMENLTCPLPQASIDTSKINIPTEIVDYLADPKYGQTSEIDILIGGDLYYQLLCSEVVHLGPHLPTLQKSKLGWFIGGIAPVKKNKIERDSNLRSCMFVNSFNDNQDLSDIMSKFWRLEEVDQKQIMSSEEKLCENIFSNSVSRLIDGSFQVDILLRAPEDAKRLGESFTFAKNRFLGLEKRFIRDRNFFLEYKQFIEEYVNLGHGKYVSFDENSENLDKNFLPHHAVLREQSSSTRLRVVFDASMKTSSGISLNDILLKGYMVQPELFNILCRFRTFTFVLTADIQKMYRMIKIRPEQRCLQNILWRESPNETYKCVELQTVTYGTKSAPYLATRCLVKLAEDNANQFPLASSTLLHQTYMDDILGGTNSKEDLERLQTELVTLLKSGGFHLHKIRSNESSIVLQTSDDIYKVNIVDESQSSKILGLEWYPDKDVFQIAVPVQGITCKSFTKRQVLANIAQIFDPLGLVGPVVVSAKILMQEIWLSKIGWDDELPRNLENKWQIFLNELSNLSEIKIPRAVFLQDSVVQVQLHGFSDASMVAYGACVYIRVVYVNKGVSCHLLCAKSKVKPLKVVSLPRLELCGAVLLSKLVQKIVNILEVTKVTLNKIHLWTDSKIVLCWLNDAPSRWSVFVANRVAEIQNITAEYNWCHVESKSNPADLLTRGLTASKLISNKLWWNGPEFLHNPEFVIHQEQFSVENIPEQKKAVHTQFSISEVIQWDRFSNFSRLQRTVAFCLRFCNNAKKYAERITGPLTAKELREASLKIVYRVQQENFCKELKELETQGFIKNKNLRGLNPFIDKDGLLRVNGRLANANIDFDHKFPLLLPANHHVVRLLIKLEHIRLCHAGPQAVLSALRLRYWPLRGIREVKRVIKGCLPCFRFRTGGANQIMGSLPAERVSVSRAFYNVGIDFGGPILIKQSRLRKASTSKAYIALFVCMATKAIHLELVSNLSTEAFILALKRFISRRGCPKQIFSDNATNFKGTDNHLREVSRFFREHLAGEKFQDFVSNKEISWNFIPPNSPHWGGIWEAGIKSVKYHLKRTIGNICLTFEEMSTVLSQIEAILNSRPLCLLSSDPADISCLTPGHFLIGQPLTAFPERDVTEIPDNRLKFFQQCSKIQQSFWKRWSKDYLNTLQNRPKWVYSKDNLKVDDIVLLKEDNIPPLNWPLGRIIQVFPGSDNKVRAAKIKTQTGEYIRPIVKLCPLPRDSG